MILNYRSDSFLSEYSQCNRGSGRGHSFMGKSKECGNLERNHKSCRKPYKR